MSLAVDGPAGNWECNSRLATRCRLGFVVPLHRPVRRWWKDTTKSDRQTKARRGSHRSVEHEDLIGRLRRKVQSSSSVGFIASQPQSPGPEKSGDADAATRRTDFGETRNPARRIAERFNDRGNLAIDRSAARMQRRSGATWRFTIGAAGRRGNRGNSKTRQEAVSAAEIWGHPNIRCDESQRMRDARKLNSRLPAAAKSGAGQRGNPLTPSSADGRR